MDQRNSGWVIIFSILMTSLTDQEGVDIAKRNLTLSIIGPERVTKVSSVLESNSETSLGNGGNNCQNLYMSLLKEDIKTFVTLKSFFHYFYIVDWTSLRIDFPLLILIEIAKANREIDWLSFN